MKLFHIHLDSDRMSVVSVSGATGSYEVVEETYKVTDYVVRDEVNEMKFRVPRTHILYVISAPAPEDSTSE